VSPDTIAAALLTNAAAIFIGVIWLVRRLTKIETDVAWLIAHQTRKTRIADSD